MPAATVKVLSLIPPMTQLNTPYPSTAYLTGFLRSRGLDAAQEDLALGLVLRVLSREGLDRLKQAVLAARAEEPHAGGDANPAHHPRHSATLTHFLEAFDRYRATIEPTIAFLQGRDPTLAHRISARAFLPEGPRFHTLMEASPDEHGLLPEEATPDDGQGHEGDDPLGWAFGAMGLQDRARHLATLYLNDLADVIRDAVDPQFQFVRYAERLATSQPHFDPLAQALARPPHLLDELLAELTLGALHRHRPDLVLLSVPFPGAVYGALRIAQTIKAQAPDIKVALGGGFVNTELRELSEPRLFDLVDFVTLDAGERPLLALIEHLQGRRGTQRLVRTFVRERDPDGSAMVRFINFMEADIPFSDVGTPTWDGLPLDRYLSLLDMLNPVNRLWSDGRWNKLTVAHGCYWKKCSFCDVSLDYISRYEAASATLLVDRIEAIIRETGQTGFHFVDEAAPPKALKALAEELIRREVTISWWGNIRFEKTFTPELCNLLADSGCVAVTGGLEVASDRLLQLMKKGVTVDQVARVTRAFADAGVMVHAYLMYGFPTQTVQDTVDALEYVRQLFLNGCIHSGFFHRFACTVHSPVGQRPQDYGITLEPLPDGRFAKNDVGFIDPTGTDHDTLGLCLKKAIYNFMHAHLLEEDVRMWFAEHLARVPKPTVGRQRIAKALRPLDATRSPHPPARV